MSMKFYGHILAMRSKDDDETADCDVVIEVTEFRNDGRIEIGFNDRDERMWVQFSLPDLMLAIAALRGEKQ